MVSSQIFAIPVGADHFLMYAPLHGLAFLGNRSLLTLIAHRAEGRKRCEECTTEREAPKAEKTNPAVESFLAELDRRGLFRTVPEPADDPAVAAPGYDTAVLFLTNRCNLRCVYCYAEAGGAAAEDMPWPLARAAVDRVLGDVIRYSRPGMTLAFHGGGEPSLNRRVLVRSVDHARTAAARRGVPLQVTGAFNGCWTPEIRRYILANFTELSLSFDGLPEVQDTQRPGADGRGSWRRVARTLESLDGAGFRYGIRLTVTRDHVGRLAESIDHITARFRPHTIQAEPAFPTGRARRQPATLDDPTEFLRQFTTAYDLAAARGVRLFYSGARPEELTRRFCLAPCRALVVTPAGEVSACFEVYGRRHPLSRRFLVGQWDGADGFTVRADALRRIRARTVDRLRGCDSCFCRWHCAGDCAPGRIRTGRSLPLRCLVNQELTKFLLLKQIQSAGGVLWIRPGSPADGG
jgi:uncharacterized protein